MAAPNTKRTVGKTVRQIAAIASQYLHTNAGIKFALNHSIPLQFCDCHLTHRPLCDAKSGVDDGQGDDDNRIFNMKTLSTKVTLSALAVAALLTSPAFAKSHRQVSQDNAAIYNAVPGSDIPAYDSEGGVVGIANPDLYGAQSQR
jgi:hypothetical protein